MAEDRFQETEEGYYVQSGDVLEWRWNKGKEPKLEVPKGEFDPRSADEPEPKPKPPAKAPEKKK